MNFLKLDQKTKKGLSTVSRLVNQTITESLRELLGEPVVLLRIGYGQKAPFTKGWQETTTDDCDEEHLRLLDMGRYNIGVLLGKASGGLCSVDIDNEANIEPFLKNNPRLQKTLRTKGRRGCNLWVRIEGEYPPLSRIKSRDGQQWGEWRADGGQTVIYGRHPDGDYYQILVDEPVVTIAFEDIDWSGLVVLWQQERTSETNDDKSLTVEEQAYQDVVHQFGNPLEISEKGTIKLNHYFFVGRFSVEHKILHEPSEKEFYVYEPERGLWRKKTIFSVKDRFAMDLKSFADLRRISGIHFMLNNNLLSSLSELLRGRVEKCDAFRMRRDFIHLGNGILQIQGDNPGLYPFSPDYFSRNQCPVDLVAGETCPRFINELLKSALDEDDIDLLQRWAGSLLLGGNVAQRIFLITGTPGGGKSTLLEILETIVGEENIHELRTDHLHERFELQFFIGKTLLTGKDVPGDFLQRRGASMLKKLVGNDSLSPEKKGGNDALRMRGNFDVAVTANSRLHVRLDGDSDAWRRRLVVIRYERPKPKKRIANFGQILLKEEGSGILNWMIKGAIRYIAEVEEHGDFVLTQQQRQRVDDLLAESDSVRAFVQSKVQLVPFGDVTTEEIIKGYRDYCEEKDWNTQTQKQVERQLPDVMMESFGVARSHKIERHGRSLRGYPGVGLIS